MAVEGATQPSAGANHYQLNLLNFRVLFDQRVSEPFLLFGQMGQQFVQRQRVIQRFYQRVLSTPQFGG